MHFSDQNVDELQKSSTGNLRFVETFYRTGLQENLAYKETRLSG